MAFPWSEKPKPYSKRPSIPKEARNTVPYHSNLNTKMLRIGRDYLRLVDFFEAFAIFGAPGSGKTSASFFYYLLSVCAAGMGGIYCVYKMDAVAVIEKAAALTGRTGDLVYLSRQHINLLNFVMEHLGGKEFGQNLVAFMEHMMDAARKASGTSTGSDTSNRYFTDGALKMAYHAFALLQASWGTIQLADLYEFITTVPMSAAEVASDEWKSTFCYKTHARLATLAKEAEAAGKPDARLQRAIDEHGNFFLVEVANLDPRPKPVLSAL
jgi:hypothetical protein